MQKAAKRAARGAAGAKAAMGGARGWVAMGALAAYAAVGSGKSAALTTVKEGSAGEGGPAATLPLKRFEIGAGPLDTAVAEYERTASVSVRVDLPAGTLAGFQTKGVKGLYRPEEALRLLLEGTGLSTLR